MNQADGLACCTVSCSSDFTIKLWDTNNDWKNIRTLHGHDHSISSARFLPSDDMIVSASRDRTIRIWEVASGYAISFGGTIRCRFAKGFPYAQFLRQDNIGPQRLDPKCITELGWVAINQLFGGSGACRTSQAARKSRGGGPLTVEGNGADCADMGHEPGGQQDRVARARPRCRGRGVCSDRVIPCDP